MEDQDRDDDGRFSSASASVEDVLSIFSDHEPRTASEVADILDVSRRTALRKLNQLHEDGQLNKKKVGARAVVWWRPDR